MRRLVRVSSCSSSTALSCRRRTLGRTVETRSFTVLGMSTEELFVVEWVSPDRSRRVRFRIDEEEMLRVLRNTSHRSVSLSKGGQERGVENTDGIEFPRPTLRQFPETIFHRNSFLSRESTFSTFFVTRCRVASRRIRTGSTESTLSRDCQVGRVSRSSVR